MTEYWVSQGNKWCDTCKIFISNNPSSIRNHELGQRHKDNVAKRLNDMREEKVKKDKAEKQAARVLDQIEAKAKRSYQKDLESFKEARETNAQALVTENVDQRCSDGSAMPGDWELESSSGYYCNRSLSCYYDPSSGFYYTDALGKWVTQEEAFASFQASSVLPPNTKPNLTNPPPHAASKTASTSESGAPPGRLVTTPPDPTRRVKGSPSSIAVNKRKRADEKPKQPMSKEEAEALKAREAARKRVEEREKPLLGLYKR